jgi:hypothetical protein
VEDICDATNLDVFVNLTSLDIDPLSHRVCDFIARSSPSLITFKARVNRAPQVSTAKLIDTLSSNSLSTVETMALHLEKYHLEDGGLVALQPGIHVITTRMQDLQHLDLNMGLDLRWCPQFAQLSNLKELVWTVTYAMDAFRSASDQDPPGDEWLAPDDEAEKAFSEAFAGFVETPLVRITLDQEGYWGPIGDQRDLDFRYHGRFHVGEEV